MARRTLSRAGEGLFCWSGCFYSPVRDHLLRSLGLIATRALIANLILIVGIVALLRATLSMPGIAGIVLTLRVAVDARTNVLINERIKEELGSNGRTVAALMKALSWRIQFHAR